MGVSVSGAVGMRTLFLDYWPALWVAMGWAGIAVVAWDEEWTIRGLLAGALVGAMNGPVAAFGGFLYWFGRSPSLNTVIKKAKR